MSEARFLFLSQEDVVAAGGLDMPETIEIVEHALRLHGHDLIAGSDVLVCNVWEHETGHASRAFARALEQGLVTRDRVAQLGEVLLGIRPGRTHPSQRVFVSPIGLAIEDVADARLVYRRADELGIGTPLALWKEPIWS
jgi:hypothetical protein